jgi:hypothetical protein
MARSRFWNMHKGFGEGSGGPRRMLVWWVHEALERERCASALSMLTVTTMGSGLATVARFRDAAAAERAQLVHCRPGYHVQRARDDSALVAGHCRSLSPSARPLRKLGSHHSRIIGLTNHAGAAQVHARGKRQGARCGRCWVRFMDACKGKHISRFIDACKGKHISKHAGIQYGKCHWLLPCNERA